MNIETSHKPLLRGHFHQAMFFISLGACILLVIQSSKSAAFLSTIIYSLGVLAMFGISALYHRINWSPKGRVWLKKLDHSGIYLMIAGSVTPVSHILLPQSSSNILLLTIWGIALFGIIQSMIFVHLPKIVSSLIYLIAGYMVLPYMPELSAKLSTSGMFLLIAGGVSYSVGALVYGFKWPKLDPKTFGYHELFHVFVSVGAILHFALVYSLV